MPTDKMKVINTEKAPEAVGAYSQGVFYNGIYYFSGQIGLDANTKELRPDFRSQLDQVMTNIDGLLQAEDLKRENIIKTTIFLTDLTNFSTVNEVYENYFTKPFPARSCVQVSALPKGSLVEIEVLAAKE